MALFGPSWKSKNVDKAIEAVAKITDQETLRKAACHAPNARVRRTAVKKITNQTVVLNVAQKDSDMYVRMAATERLTDQSVLQQFAKNDWSNCVREAAIRKLTDQNVLADIAMSDTDMRVREAAIERMTDQKILAEIAKRDYPYQFGELCRIMVQKLTNEALLADVAINATHHDAQVTAVKKMRDQNLLVVVAKNTNNSGIGFAVIEKLKNENMLVDIAKNAQVDNVRIAAMKKLADQTLFYDIAMLENSDSKKAISFLTDKKLLADIVRQAKYTETKHLALQKSGGYICSSCNHENWPGKEQPASCICSHCDLDNHEFQHCSNITEFRDYEVGFRWKECKRCGLTKNHEWVNTM